MSRSPSVLTSPRLTARREQAKPQRLLAEAAVWGTLAAVVCAEVITTYGDPRWGVALHVLLLTAFLSFGTVDRNPARGAFYLSLSLAPLIRIVSLGLPLGQFPQADWYLLTAIPLFSAVAVIARFVGVSRRSLGLCLPASGVVRWEIAVALSGGILGFAEYAILRPAPLAPGAAWASLALDGLILLIGTGLMEELVFRGLLQRTARGVLTRGWALLYVSLLFGALHIGHRSLLDDVFVILVAVYFGLVVSRTRSLLGVTVAHGTINIMLFLVLPRLWG